jgi:predicted anti-sigma-YlaC factor YlaD
MTGSVTDGGASLMRTCQDFMKSMDAFLDGELDAQGMARVQSHLRECTGCRDAFTVERTFLELIRSVFVCEPFTDERMQSITEKTGDRLLMNRT